MWAMRRYRKPPRRGSSRYEDRRRWAEARDYYTRLLVAAAVDQAGGAPVDAAALRRDVYPEAARLARKFLRDAEQA